MRTTLVLTLLAASTLASACRQQQPAETPAQTAGGAAAVPAEPPPPPPPVEAPFEAAAVSADGVRTPIALDGSTQTVPPDARLELTSPRAFKSLRARLFDDRDRLVPSSDEIAIGQGTTIRVQPQEPLEPGASYRILVDDARDGMPRDIEDTLFEPRSFRFTIATPTNGTGGEAGTPAAP